MRQWAAWWACVWLLAPVASAQREFAPPVNVSTSPDNSRLAALVTAGAASLADDQVLWAFWQDFSSVPNLVWCNSDEGAGWGVADACEPNVDRGFGPRALPDADGGVHLVWRGRVAGVDDIWYSHHDGAAWSAPTNVSATAEASANPTLAVSGGALWVLWEQRVGADVRFYESRDDGSGWSPSRDTGLPYDGASVDTIRIAGGLGGLHAVWADFQGAFQEVFHSFRPDGGSWRAPRSLSESPFEESVEPAIDVGADGTVHVAWVEQDPLDGSIFEVVARSRPAWRDWDPVRAVSDHRAGVFRPVVMAGVLDLGRRVRIAWQAATPAGEEVYYQDRPGGPVQDLSESPGLPTKRPAISLWAGAWPVVAWTEEVTPGNFDVLVRRGCADFEWNNCNGIDDDCNGLVDDSIIEGDCCDRIDNDCDGLIDLEDWDCSMHPGCDSPERFACDDGLDGDGDGLVDCADPDCCGQPACDGAGELDCDDGVDNDCDYRLDCEDPDCDVSPGCAEADCANGLDDDGDGATDCEDRGCCTEPACAGAPACGESDCANGLDDDGDGAADCLDEDCVEEPPCAAEDFDGDGATNSEDCAPLDPGARAVPDESRPLLVTRAPTGEIRLDWPPASAFGSGTTHAVAGAALTELRASEEAAPPCLVRGLTDPTWTDPRPGQVYWLVRAENACGPDAGRGWGLDSGGAERPACP